MKNKENIIKQETLDDLLSMSEHWNGYKREYAVRHLGNLSNQIAISTLIIRVNDWVPQVRAASVESLNKLLKNGNADAFIASLPALYHLNLCGRYFNRYIIIISTEYIESKVCNTGFGCDWLQEIKSKN